MSDVVLQLENIYILFVVLSQNVYFQLSVKVDILRGHNYKHFQKRLYRIIIRSKFTSHENRHTLLQYSQNPLLVRNSQQSFNKCLLKAFTT